MEIKEATVAQEIQVSSIWQGISGSAVFSILKWDNDAVIAPEGISGRVGVWRVSGWHLQWQLMLPVCERWKCDKGLCVADRRTRDSVNTSEARKDMEERIYGILFYTCILGGHKKDVQKWTFFHLSGSLVKFCSHPSASRGAFEW